MKYLGYVIVEISPRRHELSGAGYIDFALGYLAITRETI